MKWFGIVTLFPEMFRALEHDGVVARALRQGDLQIECFNPRDFARGNYKSVDDQPYGGGAGMVLRPQELSSAHQAARARAVDLQLAPRSLLLSPQGELFDNERAQQLGRGAEGIILIAGRYEGVDQRFIDSEVDGEISIGDYIITGGELAAMVIIDASMRFSAHTLGNSGSNQDESFSSGLLEYPQYTRSQDFNGHVVPEVLLSGDHARIRRWRRQQSLGRTWQRRPDLLSRVQLSSEDQALLSDFQREHS